MMLPYESMELEYYTLMIRKIAKERGCSTWHTAKVIEIQDDKVVFGMSKVYGRFTISKAMVLDI